MFEGRFRYYYPRIRVMLRVRVRVRFATRVRVSPSCMEMQTSLILMGATSPMLARDSG